jgi:hypothetical protein
MIIVMNNFNTSVSRKKYILQKLISSIYNGMKVMLLMFGSNSVFLRQVIHSMINRSFCPWIGPLRYYVCSCWNGYIPKSLRVGSNF